jgi:WS/DGAT/MGAT family acyltransferase
MQQLSGLDALFLSLETAKSPLHIGSLSIWDPSTAPGEKVRFKRIIQTLTERAHLAPFLRQRLLTAPLDADLPYWIRDTSFDPEFHVRHIALPKPGDLRQLFILTARIHARALDRGRPLWELYVIEGLDRIEGVPPGSFAYLSKIHHAVLDGVSSKDLGAALCDPTPKIRSIGPATVWRPDRAPTSLELAARTLYHGATRPVRFADTVRRLLPSWLESLQAVRSGRLRAAPKAPRVRFNSAVSPHRAFEGVAFPLDEMRAIKSVVCGTVNDVVLAVCAGALGHYLIQKNELPGESLVAQCPISTRDRSAAATGGNQVTAMAVALRTDIPEAGQRLSAICDETRNAKALVHAVRADAMVEMADHIPMFLAAMGARVAA